MIIDMSNNDSTTATYITNVGTNSIDSSTPYNGNNVSSTRNILADYHAAILNRTSAATAILATTTSSNKPVAAINSVTIILLILLYLNNLLFLLQEMVLQMPGVLWWSPSAPANKDFFSDDEMDGTDSEDNDLTWEKLFNTYEFNYLCSGEKIAVQKQSTKRKTSSNSNIISLSSLEVVKRQRKDKTDKSLVQSRRQSKRLANKRKTKAQ